MYISLVSAPTITEFSDADELSCDSVFEAASEPQLGILSLAAVLEARGDRTRITNLNWAYLDHAHSANGAAIGDFSEAAARKIVADDADVYGFSSLCNSYPLTVRIAEALKALRPQALILFGGPQASVVDLETLAAFPFVDFVLRGEAEITLPLLLDQLVGKHRLEQVPGLSYRLGPRAHRNANAPVITDLDALPTPAYHLTTDLQGARRVALELGRGCPFACTFCSTNDFFRRNFRLRSPQRILRDMRIISTRYGIRDFELVHDMFTVDRKRVVLFCEAMLASGEDFTWSCSARTDCVDDDLLELMARAGCRGIFFGVESGSERMQKIIDKHLDPMRAEEIIDLTERHGIRSTVALITGFPEENRDDLRDTMRVFMHSTRCPSSHPQLNLLAPLAATSLYSSHKHELFLDEFCSSMSHQGHYQKEADLKLIRTYPEIFPNFYTIPTPHLDRSYLIELREFALMAVERFRWLLVAVDQATSGILDFFGQWQIHRCWLRPALTGPELRHYYRTENFQGDFLSFVSEHGAAKRPAVAALLDYERGRRRTDTAESTSAPCGEVVPHGNVLRPADRPRRKERVTVIELAYDVQSIVDALKVRAEPVWKRGPHFYITREVSAGIDRLDQVSDWMASLLRLCDGERDVKDIVEVLSAKLSGIAKPLRGYACMRLLAGAQTSELIDVYRRSSAI
jgi:radical SAM superfamily enzyme YgiQ (UPF0313 family)